MNMKNRALFTVVFFGTIVLTSFTRNASAYIERMYSLAEVLDESTNILVGKIAKVDKRRRVAEAVIERTLKGETEYHRIQMNLSAGISAEARYLLDIWEPGDPFLLFYSRQGSRIASLGHAGDTWFQLHASHRRDEKRVWWRFTHIEIYMGRTFNGTTPELIQLSNDVLHNRKKPPRPDRTVRKLDVRKLRRSRAKPARTRERDASEPIIARRATWKYFKGKSEASGDAPRHSAWREVDFDDSSWASAPAPFGYGDGPFGTTLLDMRKRSGRPGYSSLFLRRRFQVADPSRIRELAFNIDFDDGFIIWLNGKEALSVHPPRGTPAYNKWAPEQHESGAYERFELSNPGSFVVRGTNVIAVQVFNYSLTSSDLKMDLELRADVSARSPFGRFRRIVDLRQAAGEVRGISWVDVNGDEQLDAYFCRGARDVLLVSDGDNFRDWGRQIGLSAGSRAASWADYNGDDHPDLLTADFQIFTNVGGRLQRSRLLSAPKNRNSEGSGWIDYNGDGLPDVLVTNGEHGISLFENTGRGPRWFRDVSARAGLGAQGLGRGNGDFVVFADYDGDGYTDFLYNLGRGVLAHNEGDGTFALDTESGIELPGTDYKRGLAFVDFDNDGDLDLFVPAATRSRLYRNNNDGTFTDVIGSTGDLARNAAASFSGAWGDVNGDGFLDLFVCHTKGPSRLYLNDGQGKFQDVTSKIGLSGLTPAYAASFADVDGDGDLDLAVNLENRVVLALNEMRRNPNFGSFKVRLRVQRGLVGSVVRVFDRRGRPLGIRELNGAESCGGQASPIVHFTLPVGRCKVSAVLSDGRVAQKTVLVKPDGMMLTLRESEFKE